MTINEKNRLDLRQALEQLFADQRLAEIAMEAMPPIDYSKLATTRDVGVSAAELRGEMAELRGDFTELRGEFAELRGDFTELRGEFAGLKGEFAELGARVDTAMANNLRTIVASQVATMLMLGGWFTALMA
jgi:hypothetical protein